MNTLIAVVLGLVQGLSEFIPISSTAHLTLAATALDVLDPAHPERWTAFMATIQLGTVASVVIYFRQDVANMLKAFFSENLGKGRRPFKTQSESARLAWMVIVATLPIVVIGLAVKDFIEGSFTKDINVIAISLIAVAGLLWWGDKKATFKKTSSDITVKDAFWVGAAQVLALIPGSSRSGTTIMAGLFRGLTREHAARFSFLMSIPAVTSAGVLEFVGELDHISWASGGADLVVATIVSGLSGYAAIAFLLKFLRTHSLNVFIVYRVLLGLSLFLVSCTPQEPVEDTESDSVKASIRGQASEVVGNNVAPEVSADSIEITSKAIIYTTMGRITIGLYGLDAPKTVSNFEALAKRRYFDRTSVHRVSRDFVIQMGDPNTRDRDARSEWGIGGETADGEILPEELDASTPSGRQGYYKGVVAMARKPASGTGTSQFFICLDSTRSMPYQYTIFGRVIDGMDVVEKIADVEVEPGLLGDNDGIPVTLIGVRRIRIR